MGESALFASMGVEARGPARRRMVSCQVFGYRSRETEYRLIARSGSECCGAAAHASVSAVAPVVKVLLDELPAGIMSM